MNPRSKIDKNAMSALNLNSIIPQEARGRANAKLCQLHKDGRYLEAQSKTAAKRTLNGFYKHTEYTKRIMSIAALNSNHQRVCKNTHGYTDKKVELLDLIQLGRMP
jgi:hypothetical protein